MYLASNHHLATRYRRHLEGNLLAVSFITVAELFYTARQTRAPARTAEYWRARLPAYVFLGADMQTCDVWARITAECSARGRRKQDNDLWIAATALRHDLALVTHNRRDFDDVPELTVISEAPERP